MSTKKSTRKKNGVKPLVEKVLPPKTVDSKKKPEPGTWEAVVQSVEFAEKTGLTWP